MSPPIYGLDTLDDKAGIKLKLKAMSRCLNYMEIKLFIYMEK